MQIAEARQPNEKLSTLTRPLRGLDKPVHLIVLARTMTDACKSHIIDAGINKYLIFEKSDDSHTTVYGNGWSETYEGQYWCLDEFLKVW